MQSEKTKRKGQFDNFLMANQSKVFKRDVFSINTSNKYEALADEDNINPNIIKSPPIYVHDVININFNFY